MALGQTYNNNKTDYTPSVYSGYKVINTESSVDITQLNFSYWNSMLKISIVPRKNTANPEEFIFDTENSGAIYINHLKAKIFYDEICRFQQDPEGKDNVGINSGKGVITLSTGKEFGTNSLCLVIRGVDIETGVATSEYVYEFKKNYYYSLVNYKGKDGSFEKVMEPFNNLELEMVKTLLIGYYEAMSHAFGYSAMMANQGNYKYLNKKIDTIIENAGIQTYSNSNKTNYQNNAFNKQSTNNRYNQSSLDDIDD